MNRLLRHIIQARHMRAACIVLGFVIIALVIALGRVFYGSMQAYHQGAVRCNEHQYTEAITFFDRSIHWYAPFNPYVWKSAKRLWEISLRAEQQGDIRLALIAIRTIRRGFYSARSVHTPGKDWIKKCDIRIGELIEIDQSTSMPRGPAGANESPVRPTKTVGASWSIIVEIGFLGWVGSMLGFIIFACQGNGKAAFLSSQGLRWGSLALIFFILWIIGMVKA